MQYALVIYAEPGSYTALSDAERDADNADYRSLAEDPRCTDSARLGSAETATCVRVEAGRTLVTDGPFADTKEVLGGFYLIEVPDLDAAIELAARIPASRRGAVEIRPVIQP